MENPEYQMFTVEVVASEGVRFVWDGYASNITDALALASLEWEQRLASNEDNPS